MTDKEYYDLIQPYHDAMKLLLTRLEVLNHTIYPSAASNPVHTVQSRIKKKASIEEKLMQQKKIVLEKQQASHNAVYPAVPPA